MARIRLYLQSLVPGSGLPYHRRGDRSGTVYHLPLLRLTTRLFVLPHERANFEGPGDVEDEWKIEAILDTGAPLSVFPFRVWQPFRDAVRGLDQPPAGPHGRRLTILGGPFPYRLGRLRFGAYDRTGDWLPAVTSNAWFLDDATGAPGQAVPGLRTRLFEARQLRCEDAPGDPFGQRWVLEDS